MKVKSTNKSSKKVVKKVLLESSVKSNSNLTSGKKVVASSKKPSLKNKAVVKTASANKPEVTPENSGILGKAVVGAAALAAVAGTASATEYTNQYPDFNGGTYPKQIQGQVTTGSALNNNIVVNNANAKQGIVSGVSSNWNSKANNNSVTVSGSNVGIGNAMSIVGIGTGYQALHAYYQMGSVVGGLASGGGQESDGARYNSVTVTNSSTDGRVVGGLITVPEPDYDETNKGKIEGNKATVTNSTIRSGGVYGGVSESVGKVENNIVNVANSTLLNKADIIGGGQQSGGKGGNSLSERIADAVANGNTANVKNVSMTGGVIAGGVALMIKFDKDRNFDKSHADYNTANANKSNRRWHGLWR